MVLVAVLAIHAALISLLLLAYRGAAGLPTPEHPIEVMFLPPKKVQQVRIEHVRPTPVSTNVMVALAPPLFNSSSQSGTSSAPDGHGSTVNWTAEAHRAVKAFEIRRDQPQNTEMSPLSRWDEWWTHEHHAGDQAKTPNGDWIVWINAKCYQVASWHSNATVPSAESPPTVCRADGDPSHDDAAGATP